MAYRRKYSPNSKAGRAEYNRRRAAAKKGWENRGKPKIKKTSRRRKKSGCYIATCVYGSYDCPQVWTLRRYRDEHLANSLAGRFFIRCYYAISPSIVKIFGNSQAFKNVWKKILDRKIRYLNQKGIDNSPYSL